MPIYLGTTPVTLKLGTQNAAGFLGDAAVTVVARTLYFTGAVDDDWAELGNWFDDAEGTVAAASLPTAADSVVASASISSNSGSAPTVVDFTLNDPNAGLFELGIAITVTGNATFNGGSVNNGNVGGNATFNDNFFGASANSGTVTGTATFNGSSANASGGTVTGNSTFNDNSANDGTVNGNATFNGSSQNQSTVTGTATFNDSACNFGGTAGTFVPDPPPSCE